MKTIYVNNLRGFTDSFIEIRDVNFFIGENSTGKTTILKIIRALFDKDFWLNEDLNFTIANMGYFHEIVNELGSNSTFFELGLYDSKDDIGIKLKYGEKKGMPYLLEISILNKNINIEYIEIQKGMKYRFKTEFIEFNNLEGIYRFEKWVKQSYLNSEKYQQIIPETNDLIIDLPLFLKINIHTNSLINNRDNYLNIEHCFKSNLLWFAPIRTNPRRVYDEPLISHSSDGSHTPFLLREFLNFPIDEPAKQRKVRLEKILNKFGEDSGLFDSITIKQFEQNNTSPFQLQININGRKMNFTNVGYGISQILPLLVEIIVSPKDYVFSIQQPEVHLHPKAQAAFGDFVFKSFIEENKCFIIETHSDYLIDRFRIKINNYKKEKTFTNIKSQIVFFSKGMTGNMMTPILIDEDGNLPDEQPKEYREFFINEQFKLLDI